MVWFVGIGWVDGGYGVPGVEVSSALGDVRGYEFGNCEKVYYRVMCSSWEVWGEGVVFFLIFICGVLVGREEAVVCNDEGVVVEEI